jgi:hypothetical protein
MNNAFESPPKTARSRGLELAPRRWLALDVQQPVNGLELGRLGEVIIEARLP